MVQKHLQLLTQSYRCAFAAPYQEASVSRCGTDSCASRVSSAKLISSGADSVAFMIQVNTGQELFHIVNEDWVEDLTFSPDGSWFVTVSDDQRIRVWDTKTGAEKVRMLQDSYLSSVAVSRIGSKPQCAD